MVHELNVVLQHLMGDKVEPRRKWIEANVDFGMEEDDNILENEFIQHEEEV